MLLETTFKGKTRGGEGEEEEESAMGKESKRGRRGRRRVDLTLIEG